MTSGNIDAAKAQELPRGLRVRSTRIGRLMALDDTHSRHLSPPHLSTNFSHPSSHIFKHYSLFLRAPYLHPELTTSFERARTLVGRTQSYVLITHRVGSIFYPSPRPEAVKLLRSDWSNAKCHKILDSKYSLNAQAEHCPIRIPRCVPDKGCGACCQLRGTAILQVG